MKGPILPKTTKTLSVFSFFKNNFGSAVFERPSCAWKLQGWKFGGEMFVIYIYIDIFFDDDVF